MEYKLKLHPTYGFVPNISNNSFPGILDKNEKQQLRSLAMKVAEIANDPIQAKKRALWFSNNALKKSRPPILVFPEDSWFEMIDLNSLLVKDPYWRQWEWELKHLIYRHEHLNDDFVIEPRFDVLSVLRFGGWGVNPVYKIAKDKGAYSWEPPLKNESDFESLEYPVLESDAEGTKGIYEAVGELFGDILPVSVQCGMRLDIGIISTVAILRGMEQVMLDMYDRPDWLHKVLSFITDGLEIMIRELESAGHFTLNNRNHYVDAGGLGYTDELPGNCITENVVHTNNLWVHAPAQEYSEVSPAMHDEFGFSYQEKLLRRYGLVAYGCCEPYTHKFEMIKRLPNLRRVSVSPWSDIKVAAESLADRYIFSWKPSPVYLAYGFDEDAISSDICRMLDVTKDCIPEIILKDTFTIQNDPLRFEKWLQIAHRQIDAVYS